MALKKVSKRYALNEFNTIGLILIIYCLFVLFLPLVIGELLTIEFGELTWHNIDLILAIKIGLMIIGTLLPFGILNIKAKQFRNEKVKLKISAKQIIVQTIVFFSATSVAIFAMTAIGSYFGFSGVLVSGIGISIDSSKLNDILYVLMFVVISPLLEEFAFRGVLLKTLSKYGKYFALYASALIFSLAHGSFMEFIPSYIMGVLLGKIALRYKTIKPTIWIHILFNLILYVSFLIPEKLSLYIAGFYALIFVSSIVLYFTHVYRPITVKKSNSNSKVTIMFITTFSVMVSMFLFVAHSVLTILLR